MQVKEQSRCQTKENSTPTRRHLSIYTKKNDNRPRGSMVRAEVKQTREARPRVLVVLTSSQTRV